MPPQNPQADEFFAQASKWPLELVEMRRILLASGLTEEIKWAVPCYTFGGALVVGIGELNDACAFSFFKGVLLKDPEGILSPPGTNTRSARLVRFTSVAQILALEPVLSAYIAEAIQNERMGRKVTFEADDLEYPEELIDRLDADPALQEAFEALTPGRRRGYILFISSAKQSATRVARIEKSAPMILKGKGLHDR